MRILIRLFCPFDSPSLFSNRVFVLLQIDIYNSPVATILCVDNIFFKLTADALATGAAFFAPNLLLVGAGAAFFAPNLLLVGAGAAFLAAALGAAFFPLAKGFFATVLVAAALGAAFFAKGFPTARVAMEGAVNAEAEANKARVTTATDFIFFY